MTLGLTGWLFFRKKDKEPTDESDCHEEFLLFNENLEVTQTKLVKLGQAQRAIKKKLKSFFRSKPGYSEPRFATQGSFSTKTMIRTKRDTCDLDMGVYFFTEPSFKFGTIQKHIKEALYGHTKGKIKLLPRCVRIEYRGDFHIDMPIYFAKNKNTFLLGSKEDDWEPCDSKFFKDWVIEKTQANPQLIRLIRYFKAWSDQYKSKNKVKMPSGLVFTIWAIEHYVLDERDDIAFVQTSAMILKYLKHNLKYVWTCEMPVEPFDNVLDKLDKNQKSNFYDALYNLVEVGTLALSEDCKNHSIKSWQKLLGQRFPNEI